MIRKYKNLIPKVPASCFIFPTAEIIGSVELGEDVIVYPGTVVRAGYCCNTAKYIHWHLV